MQMIEKKDGENIADFKKLSNEYEDKIYNLEKKNAEAEKFFQSKIQQLDHKVRNDYINELEYLNK